MLGIYVYGDSISMQYGYPLKGLLGDKYDYTRLGGDNSTDLANPKYNGETSRKFLQWSKRIKDEDSCCRCEGWTLVFNTGLHDIKREISTKTINIPIDEYEYNLKNAVDNLQPIFKNFIWVRTTPVDNELHARLSGEFIRRNEDVIEYNERADKLAKNEGWQVVDAYTISKDFERKGPIYLDHVHLKQSAVSKIAEGIYEVFQMIESH